MQLTPKFWDLGFVFLVVAGNPHLIHYVKKKIVLLKQDPCKSCLILIQKKNISIFYCATRVLLMSYQRLIYGVSGSPKQTTWKFLVLSLSLLQ